MKSTRREFLAKTGLTTTGLMAASMLRGTSLNAATAAAPAAAARNATGRPQKFNMCGYAAPKLETIRVGLIGLGNRGSGAIARLRVIEGLEIKAICDNRPERVEEGLQRLSGAGRKSRSTGERTKQAAPQENRPPPATYSGSDDAWKKVCERDDIDVIYNCTPWQLHAPISVYAMEQGKHAFSEIPAAVSIDECWQLV
jgi:hypothetical protein